MSTPASSPIAPNPAKLRKELERLHLLLTATLEQHGSLVATLHPEQQPGGANLLQYLAFRTQDVRKLQDALHALGLSSMASSESHICAQIRQIMGWLGGAPVTGTDPPCDDASARVQLDNHTRQLFGPLPPGRVKHVMVTLDESSGGSLEMLEQALLQGMTVARINCAHDDTDVWERWIANMREASSNTRLACKIYLDLPGPKMRLALLQGTNRKGFIKISTGDELRLVEQGRKTRVNDETKVIACQEPGIAGQLESGTLVEFDDGKYRGEVFRRAGACWIRIIQVHGRKPRLAQDKGINFPCANLRIPAITKRDVQLLPFIAKHADLVGCSFVRSMADVAGLREAFSSFPRHPDLILKIETPEAVQHFPELLLEAMKDSRCGVMIARGDLAIELGFVHLGDVQDKILWLCEAAHVPVIWATQVLESMNKTGLATRSEITDAVQSFKAECVMLNKGRYILETLEVLQEVLQKSDHHRRKKRYTLRPLVIATSFFERHPGRRRRKLKKVRQ